MTETAYVALRLEVDAASDPEAVLAEHGLDLPQYVALRTAWLKRCITDDELVDKLAQGIKDARSAPPAGADETG